jgi:hypothetical protein
MGSGFLRLGSQLSGMPIARPILLDDIRITNGCVLIHRAIGTVTESKSQITACFCEI